MGTVLFDNGVTLQVGRTSRARAEVLDYFRARAFEFGLAVAVIAIAGGILITYAGLAPRLPRPPSRSRRRKSNGG